MAGSHLAEYLLTLPDVEVFGTYRRRSLMENLEDLRAAGKLSLIADGGNLPDAKHVAAAVERFARPDAANLIDGDMADAFSMAKIMAGLRPDRVFHLAAQSYVPASWNAPAETLHLNVIGQVNVLEGIRAAGIDPDVLVAGSSEEYGLVLEHETPIKETNPLRPLSPYAVSKVAQEMLAYQYHKSYGIRTVVTRGFNHTGPRRGKHFATSSFALQIVQIEKGLRPPKIMVGDLSSARDWTDVRDMVRGYWDALERCEPGAAYNVGSGTHRTVRSMLDCLLTHTSAQVEVETDPMRLRPSDVRLLWADCSKFQQQTGWQPEIPFEQTMCDLLDYWRARV